MKQPRHPVTGTFQPKPAATPNPSAPNAAPNVAPRPALPLRQPAIVGQYVVPPAVVPVPK